MDSTAIKRTILFFPVIACLLAGQSCKDDKLDVLSDATMANHTIEHDYVDMGLSVCWATCNIGASSPYTHGDLFSWGEIATKSSYNGWYTYKWSKGSAKSLSKYNSNSLYGYDGFADNKTVLDSYDDVATVQWGDSWRIPTRDECYELMSNCIWEWVELGDIGGYIVTSCVPGYTDRSIYLSASGGDWGGGARRTMRQGFYWLADVGDLPAQSNNFNFSKDYYGFGEGNRYIGFSVRAVRNSSRAEGVSLGLSRTTLCIEEGSMDSLTVIVRQNNKQIQTDVIFSSSNNSVASVNSSGTVYAISPGTCVIKAQSGTAFAECTVHVNSSQSVPHMVDLGLSVKWASFNLGAANPEDVGYYIAWGETESKPVYDRFSYKFITGTNSNMVDKYCNNTEWGIPDYKMILETEDDAATAIWGSGWRIPSQAEMDELLEKCTWTWTTMNGMSGYKVTSNVEGYIGNYIFLPAAGVCFEDIQSGVEMFGHYWTSSMSDASYTAAWELYFNYNKPEYLSGSRYNGYSIRPVFSTDGPSQTAHAEKVDLGLSVKWASLNIGATDPGEYGNYISWGEVSPKGIFTLQGYVYNYEQYLDMVKTDNISGTQYDIATLRWGDDWRMPTKEECEELVSQCNWTWEKYNGRNYGMKVTGPNGNSIFLPAGGYRNPNWIEVGTYGTYWTSTKSTFQSSTYMGSNYSYYFRFDNTMYDVTDYQGAIYVGQLVRPVCP